MTAQRRAVAEVMEGPSRHDPNTQDRHHHLPCLGCGELRDVHPAGEEHVLLPTGQRFGYRILSREIVFQGYCPGCQQG